MYTNLSIFTSTSIFLYRPRRINLLVQTLLFSLLAGIYLEIKGNLWYDRFKSEKIIWKFFQILFVIVDWKYFHCPAEKCVLLYVKLSINLFICFLSHQNQDYACVNWPLMQRLDRAWSVYCVLSNGIYQLSFPKYFTVNTITYIENQTRQIKSTKPGLINHKFILYKLYHLSSLLR